MRLHGVWLLPGTYTAPYTTPGRRHQAPTGVVAIEVHDPEFLDHISTRFLRDRLSETTFNQRQWIITLAQYDKLTVEGGPLGFASNMLYRQLEDAYPVETHCILREIRDGIYTPPDVYHRLLREHEEVQERKNVEVEAQRARELEALRQAWLKEGGRP